MSISDKLAYEIYIISLFHILAILFVVGFTFYLYLKSKKTQLMYNYLLVVCMLLLWMISKILKSVSPNASIRWVFIIIQYIGIDFLGFFLLLFALVYTKGKHPRSLVTACLAILPGLSFLAILTNPLHHMFYSYYDFYKDSFGPLFFITQPVQYIYLFSSIFILGKGFTRQPGFGGNRNLGRFFALIVFLPILGNIYYLLIKLTDVPWIFSFPFFDFTPITSSIALVLFMIPAIKYRFLDISNMAYPIIYQTLPTGIAFYTPEGDMYGFNEMFLLQFPFMTKSNTSEDVIASFVSKFDGLSSECEKEFMSFLQVGTGQNHFFTLVLKDSITFKVTKSTHNKSTQNKSKYNKSKYNNNSTCLVFTDISAQQRLTDELEQTQLRLSETHTKLAVLAQTKKELAQTRTQTKMAQDIHDILGHSLTVVIGTADLAAQGESAIEAQEKLGQIKELLLSSLTDLVNSLEGKSMNFENTSLIHAINSLNNETTCLDFTLQGSPYELNTKITESIFRICQEAMTNAIKHGGAKTLHCILRYKLSEVELFLIDDGKGCESIQKSTGLTGMENRVMDLDGEITFGSNQQFEASTGFHIHVQIPIVK